MPNWVKHTFIVSGEAAAVQAFRDGVSLAGTAASPSTKAADASDFTFKRIIPMPESLNIEASSDGKMGMAALTGKDVYSYLDWPTRHGGAASAVVTNAEQLRAWLAANRPEVLVLGQQYLDNLTNYGMTTWYEWANQNWDTKWDACDVSLTTQEDGSLKYYFETAWSFPEPIFEKLAEMFPNVAVNGTVDEEGGYFYGEFTLKDGVLVKSFQEGTRKGGPYDYGDEEEDSDD